MENDKYISDNRNFREKKIINILNSHEFRAVLIVVIIIDIIAVILNTITNLHKYDIILNSITFFSALIFTCEYILRIISAPLLYSEELSLKSEKLKDTIKDRAKARYKYVTSFLGIIDLISIAPFVLTFFSTDHVTKDLIDLGRVILILKILRYSHTYRMLREVISSVRYELLIALMFSTMIVSFSGILMYYIERDAQPDKFTNVGEGFWWSIITYTTVGYGDVVPITPLGKFLAGFIAVIGIVTLMLPTGILSGALMTRLQQENAKRVKEEEERRNEELS